VSIEASAAKYLLRDMHPAAREFYRRLAEEGQLATTRCERCAQTRFPPLERCPICGGQTTWLELPREGRLYAFTTQETALRFRAPAVLALAEVGEVVVPGIASEPYAELSIGQRVRVEPMPEPDTGLTLLEFASAGD